MSIIVVGFKQPDAKWKLMKAVYDACAAARVELPPEVDRYFHHEIPGKSDELLPVRLGEQHGCTVYSDNTINGYTVELSKLPPGTTHIRFYNSY